MKIHGNRIDSVNEVLIPILRPTGDILLKAQAVHDKSDFEKLVKEPEAPMVMHRGSTAHVPNFEDPGYREKQKKFNQLRSDWLVLKSLQATDGLEWENVKMEEPDTWQNWRQELVDSKFTDGEIVRIMNAVVEANGLDEDKIEEARQRFLALVP